MSVTKEPSSITRSDQITTGIRDLEDGSYFPLRITGEFEVKPGSEFSFEIKNFSMPISLRTAISQLL